MNKFLPAIVLLALLTGCATEPRVVEQRPGVAPVEPYPEAEPNIRDLLSRAQTSTPEQATVLRLRATEIAISNQDARQAELILAQMQPPTSDLDLTRYLLARARLALLNNQPRVALRATEDERLKSIPLSDETRVQLGIIRADALFQARSYVSSARERIFIDGLLAPEAQDENHERIFSTLLRLPADSLANHAEEAITNDLRGWLSLAALTRRYQDNPLQQLEELNKWKRAWSSHPATRRLPTSLQMLSSVVKEQPRIIALLLPLRGDLGPYGRAIRDGVLGAHYELNGKSQIRVYDTSNTDISSLIFLAIREGAELIIGPLSRENVTRTVQIPYLEVPVLALNRTMDNSSHPDVYQFGLAPEDEMVQVAHQVYEEGHRNALAIFPSDDWGTRNFEAFRSEWESLGGVVVESATFSNQRDYSELIKSVLNVDKSEQRATDLRRITGQRFEFNARRRQDVDFVFLLANQDQARGINPTLAFFYAEDLPVYSSSHVYEYSDSKIDAIDLNGIRFCDIPWKLTRTGPIQQAIQSAWAAAKSQLASFYALGVDAYRVFPRLQQLKQIPDQRVFGATGVLRLNEENVVIRDLMWAQFRDGEIVSAPMVVSVPQRGNVDG